jgi:hypothetical protein
VPQMCCSEAGAAAVGLFFQRHWDEGGEFCVIFMRPVVERLFLSVNNFSRWLKGNRMSEILIILAIILVWFLLQVYVLPKLGIST